MGSIGICDNYGCLSGPDAEGAHADLGYRPPEIHDPALIHVHRASDAAGGPGYSLNPFILWTFKFFGIFGKFFWQIFLAKLVVLVNALKSTVP